jgi:membrane protease YdiL (CAAX protease family)
MTTAKSEVGTSTFGTWGLAQSVMATAQLAALIAAFAGAVAVRAALAGPAGARSVPGSLVFAAVLAALAAVCGVRPTWSARSAAIGLAVAVVLVLPALAHVGVRASLPVSRFPAWALLTVFVAGAEEAFLRGALFDEVQRRTNADIAVVVTAVAFALLHVPLYGWHVLPLDLAVGAVLGATRLLAGTWTAPAIAHIGADLAGWWLL